MISIRRALLALTIAAVAAPAANGAVITFSGARSNGQALMPSSYQPLLNGYANDGAALGITITWASVASSRRAVNPGVTDHTPGDSGLGVVAYDFGSQMMQMTFSSDVEIPSFYFANYNSGNYSITFEGFDAAGNSILRQVRSYSQPRGYTWIEETAFAGRGLRSFRVTGGIFKQLDDMTVNAFRAGAVPEPGTWAMLILGMGAVGGAMRRRAQKARLLKGSLSLA